MLAQDLTLKKAEEWCSIAFPDAYKVCKVVLVKFTSENELIAAGKYQAHGNTQVAFEDLICSDNLHNISAVYSEATICLSQNEREEGEPFRFELLYIPEEIELLKICSSNIEVLKKIKTFQSPIGPSLYRLHKGSVVFPFLSRLNSHNIFSQVSCSAGDG